MPPKQDQVIQKKTAWTITNMTYDLIEKCMYIWTSGCQDNFI